MTDPDDGLEHSPAQVEQRSIGRNLLDLLMSQAVTWVLSTLVTLIQPRFLGDVGQGQLRLAYSLWLIVDVLVGFGTATYLTLQVARDRERGLAMVRPIIAWRATFYIVGWGVLAAYLVLSGASRQLVSVVILIGIAAMMLSLAAVARAALVGLENMRYPAIADVVGKLLHVTLVIVVLVAGGRVVAVASVAIAASAVNAFLLVHYLRRFPRRDLSVTVPIRHIVTASAAFLVGEASLIVYQQVDTVVMSMLVDRGELGWYAAADQLFASLLFVPSILMMTLFPVFGRLHEEDPEALRRLVGRAITTLMLFSVPIGIGTLVVGPRIAPVLFGSEFEGAGPVLAVLGVVIIITTETILIGRYAIAIGHQRFWNIVMIIGIVLTIPLDLVLVPWTESRYGNGAIGGALAYVVTETFMLTVGVWKFARTAVSPTTAVKAVRILLAGAALFAAAWPLRDRFLLTPIAAGAAAYVVGVLLFGALGVEERRALSRAIASVSGRLRK